MADSNPASSWPFVSLDLPPSFTDDDVASLAQAAVDAGALGSAIEGARLTVYLDPAQSPGGAAALRAAAEAEAARLGWPALDWKIEQLPDAPWATAWKTDFRSTPIGERLLIRPDWEIGSPPPDAAWTERLPIWIRPGLGFGTGRHETTRLALEMLEKHLRPGDEALDFGAGNGVLAIAAAALGAAKVWAVENDPDANENARDNLSFNPAAACVAIIEADNLDAVPGPVDLLIANMLPHQAQPHFAAFARRLRGPQSRLIYSGVLADQIEEIEAALALAGFARVDQARLNEWAVWVGAPRGT